MFAMHGDGVDPFGFDDPAPAGATRIMVTLTPRDRTTEHLEVRHTPDIRSEDVADVLGRVVDVLNASGSGVIGNVIFGGVISER